LAPPSASIALTATALAMIIDFSRIPISILNSLRSTARETVAPGKEQTWAEPLLNVHLAGRCTNPAPHTIVGAPPHAR
jgi:hypothetical protein